MWTRSGAGLPAPLLTAIDRLEGLAPAGGTGAPAAAATSASVAPGDNLAAAVRGEDGHSPDRAVRAATGASNGSVCLGHWPQGIESLSTIQAAVLVDWHLCASNPPDWRHSIPPPGTGQWLRASDGSIFLALDPLGDDLAIRLRDRPHAHGVPDLRITPDLGRSVDRQSGSADDPVP